MSIRLDPRRLGALKLLAAEAGVRPGELVTRWVEERLDAARPGAMPTAIAPDGLAALAARVDELARRLDRMSATAEPAATDPDASRPRPPLANPRSSADADDPARLPSTRLASRHGSGKARDHPQGIAQSRAAAAAKVALHDEIAAVIAERGPQTAAGGAGRGHRRAGPLSRTAQREAARCGRRRCPGIEPDILRGRFVRRERRIGLATG